MSIEILIVVVIAMIITGLILSIIFSRELDHHKTLIKELEDEMKDHSMHLEERLLDLERPPKFKKGDKVRLSECYRTGKTKLGAKGKIIGIDTSYLCHYKSVRICHEYDVVVGNDIVTCDEYSLKKL